MKKYILSFVIILMFSMAANAQVSIIVNKSVSESSLDAGKLKSIYTLKTTKWADGSKIVVFNLKTKGESQNKFYGHIGSKANDLKKTWMKAQLTGEGKAPKSLGSEDEVVQKVASTPGAIGFVSTSKVSDDVKTIATIK
ncbi:MAG: hypothetical protein D8M58_13455 [Calditrichaeota bacterium]|nr:MAG: hypothetical protein DWQ03_00420 [Calditrichota bacterium]MBL1206405.1 hypothetical protein [Calditrichota bacterium]NOG46231.1 hypothetical protein [Calditrichota bacterium]